MNNRIRYFITGFTALIVSACEDNKNLPYPEFSKGAVATFEMDGAADGFVNILAIEDVNLGFHVNVEEFDEVNNVDIFVTFTNSDTSATVLYNAINSWPVTINTTGNELINKFDPSVVSAETLEPGDSFTFYSELVMTDGRRLDQGYSPGIVQNRNVTLNYLASCPSDIPTGTYSATSGGTSTDGCPPVNPVVNHSYTVTITSPTVGRYVVSDFSAGVYQEWYGDCYGYDFETSAVLADVCNNLSFSVTEGFGCPVTGSGTFDTETGIITYEWSNCFGDTGTVILTPQ